MRRKLNIKNKLSVNFRIIKKNRNKNKFKQKNKNKNKMKKFKSNQLVVIPFITNNSDKDPIKYNQVK